MWRHFHKLDLFREVPQAVVDDCVAVNLSKKNSMARTVFQVVKDVMLFGLFLYIFWSWYAVEERQKFVLDVDPTKALEENRLRVVLNVTIHDMPCIDLSLDYQDVMGAREVDVRSTIFKTRLKKDGTAVEILANDPQIAREDKLPRNPHTGTKSNGNTTCGSCYGALPSPPECCNTCADVMLAYRMKRWGMPRIESVVQCQGGGGRNFQPPQIMKFNDFVPANGGVHGLPKNNGEFGDHYSKDGAYPPLKVRWSGNSVLSALKNWAPTENLEVKPWPDCVHHNTVVHGFVMDSAFFLDLTPYGASAGCWQDNCARTDKFFLDSLDECAQVCAKIADCEWWSHGNEDGALKCWLRPKRSNRDRAFQFSSGARTCVPSSGESTEKKVGASSDKAEEKVVRPTDKAEEKVVAPSDNAEEEVVAPTDNAEEKVVVPSDNVEEKVVAPSDAAAEEKVGDEEGLPPHAPVLQKQGDSAIKNDDGPILGKEDNQAQTEENQRQKEDNTIKKGNGSDDAAAAVLGGNDNEPTVRQEDGSSIDIDVKTNSDVITVPRRALYEGEALRFSSALNSLSMPFVSMFDQENRDMEAKRKEQEGESCQMHGQFDANKVPGNFHIGAHGHMTPSLLGSFGLTRRTMKHTIHSLFFTEPRGEQGGEHRGLRRHASGDSLDNFASPEAFTFQYYITLTPATYVSLSGDRVEEYVYTSGSFVTNELVGPAVYFKLEIDPIRVIYTQERASILTLIVNLLAAIGGAASLMRVVTQIIDA